MIYLISFLQALSFYLFPTIVGRAITRFNTKRDIALPVISYFITGALASYLSLLIVYYGLHLIIPTIPFTPILYGVMIVLGVIGVVGNIRTNLNDINIKPYLLPASVSVVLALIFTWLWQIHSPYPLNWDMFEHQTLVNNILDGRFSFVTSQISDTFGFDGYSTLFHTLISMSQLVPTSVMLVYWNIIDFFHFFLVILASYLLAETATDNKTIGYISALLAAGIFDSSVSFTSLFLIPQTFTAVVFVLLFVQLLSEIKQRRLPSWYLATGGVLFLILSHYVIGSIAALVYVGIILYSKYRQIIIKRVNRKIIISTGILLAFIAIFASSYLSLGFLNHGEAAAFNYTFTQKFDIMRQTYGLLLLVFVPLGGILLIKTRGEIEVMMVLIAGIFLDITLLQIPYIIKYFVIGRFFIQLILAIGIYSIIRLMGWRVLQYAGITLLAIALAIIYIVNAAGWKELLRYKDIFTNVAPNEVAAANFLKTHYSNTGALLISDPATQQILEPLSGINTQGGTYTDDNTRGILNQISETTSATTAANLLYKINDQLEPATSKRLLVVSGRYFLWQASPLSDKLSYSYNIWYPADLTLNDQQDINQLISSKHFVEVYHNSTLAILEVKK